MSDNAFPTKGGVVWETHIDKRTLLKKLLMQTSKSYLTVGVHSDAGTYQDETPEGKTPVPVASVALWQEYGTVRTPARPFMYPAIMGAQGGIAKLQAHGLAAVMAGKESVEKALSRLGFFIQTRIQNQIKANTPPDLSPTYLEWRKKVYPGAGSRTLIRSGLLLRSIRYKVVVDGGQPVEGEATGAEPATPLVTEEQRAAYRQKAIAAKEQRAQQRAAAKADPAAAKAAFDAQRRVRLPKVGATHAGAPKAGPHH